jgi:hypothetical protein
VDWRSKLPVFDSLYGAEIFVLLSCAPTGSGAYPVVVTLSRRSNVWDVKLTTHRFLVPRLKMQGALPPLHMYLHDMVVNKHKEEYTFTCTLIVTVS